MDILLKFLVMVINPQRMRRGLLSLAGSWHYDTQNKHQCQANYVLFILKKLISFRKSSCHCHTTLTGFESTALF